MTRRRRFVAIKGENGDVNFFHHFAEERGGFESAEALEAQRFAKRIHFAENFAKHIIAIRAARANGKIALAQRGQQIRKRAHREKPRAARR